MSRTMLLSPLGWPAGAESGSMSWSREENERNGMQASLTLSPNGDLVMSSLSHYNNRPAPRFNAHAAAGSDEASVSMPGIERGKMPLAQAISLFRAHVDSMQVEPSFRPVPHSSPRI